jgi:hypothetical protein
MREVCLTLEIVFARGFERLPRLHARPLSAFPVFYSSSCMSHFRLPFSQQSFFHPRHSLLNFPAGACMADSGIAGMFLSNSRREDLTIE